MAKSAVGPMSPRRENQGTSDKFACRIIGEVSPYVSCRMHFDNFAQGMSCSLIQSYTHVVETHIERKVVASSTDRIGKGEGEGPFCILFGYHSTY